MDILQVSQNLYRIPIPVPFPMKYTYCYLFKESGRWAIVDAGFNYPEAQDAWRTVFSKYKINPPDVRAIYMTHFHPDHFGLAGWLQELTGSPVYMSPPDLKMAEITFKPGSSQPGKIGIMSSMNGVPDALTQQIVQHMEKLNKSVEPFPEVIPMTDKEVLLGEEHWQVIHTPGHSDGHLCFYQPKTKLLLAGDHILNKITPNVSLWPGGSNNPLKNYMESLQKITELNVELALPAHGSLITNVNERINEILQHHEERLTGMFLLAKEGLTAYQVAAEVFSHKELSPHQWRFALAETLAHLEYLAGAGRLARKGEELIVYQDNHYSSASMA